MCFFLYQLARVCEGAEGGQPGSAGDQDNAGGAAGGQPLALRQAAPPGEGESAAQVKDPRPGDGMILTPVHTPVLIPVCAPVLTLITLQSSLLSHSHPHSYHTPVLTTAQ